MKKTQLWIGAILSVAVSIFGSAHAQTASDAATNKNTITTKARQRVAAAASPVVGSGTSGQLTKWLGTDGFSFTIGNSVITENKFGLIGIGTTTPTSKLTVQGMIETTIGGYKFPDGTIQTTAGVTSIFHDASLMGNGTSGMPLGVAVPLSLIGSTSLPIFTATNTRPLGIGMSARGGDGGDDFPLRGGDGVSAIGGNSASLGGDGVSAIGGDSVSFAGDGVNAIGGFSDFAFAGDGVSARGGASFAGNGGVGVRGMGGNGIQLTGGVGVLARGGDGGPTNPFAEGGVGLFAQGGAGVTPGLAGRFIGNIVVTGNLSKGGGSFKIDHPLDPENKYLYHSFVESPEMMNIYNGNVTTDSNGDAVITLPDWFETLNKDFRYQLTVIGTFAQAIIGSEIQHNRFAIKTSSANVKVSWQVTGVRQDAYAKAHRISVEEDKPEKERGYYLHPDVFNQPEEKSIHWARHPELMKEMKEKRGQMKEEQKRTQPNQ